MSTEQASTTWRIAFAAAAVVSFATVVFAGPLTNCEVAAWIVSRPG